MISFLLTDKCKKITTCVVFALALFLILFHFTDTPKVWVDEGVFTEVSRNVERNGVFGLQTNPSEFFRVEGFVLSTSYPVIFPVALSFKIFDVGMWQARLPMVIYMFLFLLLSFLFVRKKYGDYPAILSTLLILSFSPFYGNGRPVQGEVPGLFFLVLGAYFLLFLEENHFNSKKWAILSGLALGLSSATKAVFMTFIPIALLISLIFYFKKIENKKSILFFIFSYFIPLFVWYNIHFPSGTSFSSMFSSYLYFVGNHNSSLSASQTMIHNFLRFFTESTPILFSALSLTILLSFFLRYKKEKIFMSSFSEGVLVLFIALNFIGYLKGTGWYRYFFPANILLYVLFPASVFYILKYIYKVLWRRVILFVMVALLIFQFYHLIFLSDTSFVVDRTRNTELASVLGKIDSSKSILFYNTIEAIVFFKGQKYSQYLAMDDFLVAGDKDSILKSDYDFILTTNDQGGSVSLSCYDSQMVGKYYLFQKKEDCKN